MDKVRNAGDSGQSGDGAFRFGFLILVLDLAFQRHPAFFDCHLHTLERLRPVQKDALGYAPDYPFALIPDLFSQALPFVSLLPESRRALPRPPDYVLNAGRLKEIEGDHNQEEVTAQPSSHREGCWRFPPSGQLEPRSPTLCCPARGR